MELPQGLPPIYLASSRKPLAKKGFHPLSFISKKQVISPLAFLPQFLTLLITPAQKLVR
jgi:hypothetical protein